jgi:predicted nucleotidyltransferase
MAEPSRSPLSDLPTDVARVLAEFVESVRTSFGDDLVSVVLYGSAAEGALRASSDVNLIVVLKTFDRVKADGLRDAARIAHAAVRLSPMFLLREEVEAAAEAFAQKFADVLRRRRVLHGDDPFAAVTIPRRALLVRLDQVLLNLSLRLRAFYVEKSLHEEQLVKVIADAAAPLRTAAASLLELEGQPAPSPREALARLATAFEPSFAPVLARLSDAREGKPLAPGVPSETVLQLVELATRLRARARQLA